MSKYVIIGEKKNHGSWIHICLSMQTLFPPRCKSTGYNDYLQGGKLGYWGVQKIFCHKPVCNL